MVAQISCQQWLRSSPGTAWKFSNSNYVLLAVVAERVAGVPYAEILARVITRPLGMDATTVFDEPTGAGPELYVHHPRAGPPGKGLCV